MWRHSATHADIGAEPHGAVSSHRYGQDAVGDQAILDRIGGPGPSGQGSENG